MGGRRRDDRSVAGGAALDGKGRAPEQSTEAL